MERIGYVLSPILLQNALSRKWAKGRHRESALFRRRGSDSGSSERSFGERGVNESIARIIKLRIARIDRIIVVAKFYAVGNEIHDPVRRGVVFHDVVVGMDCGIHGIRRTSCGIENYPAGARSSGVLDHQVLGTESEIQERSVGAAVPHVRSEFRETRDLRPKIRYVRLSGNVVVRGLIGIEHGSVGNAVETAGTRRRGSRLMKPSAPRPIGIRSTRLVDGLVVCGPVVKPHRFIIPVEVLRKIHRGLGTE